MSAEQKLQIAIDALRRIAAINEKSCEKYVAIADSIAIEALVELEA